MKIGFWNRLAIVLIAIATAAFPTAYVISANKELLQLNHHWRELCEDMNGDNYEQYLSCTERGREDNFLGWDEWLGAVPTSFLLAVMLYILISLVVLVARWVWRGRDAN